MAYAWHVPSPDLPGPKGGSRRVALDPGKTRMRAALGMNRIAREPGLSRLLPAAIIDDVGSTLLAFAVSSPLTRQFTHA
ncbi:hypothetical protein E0H51_29105 [Rhizobium leguminosarum bv. viciae]|uniref:hypothetical protein n=1 Tax=Rhizobium leguminosarum TaxID=384 RepID=UPI001040D9FC|nr:hypothetical protein [Rhizobium leguminosarum]TBY70734.1 hypothetical protein E0H51_29105 [Rhizobium leguminosarum bv. viciae]